MIRIVKLAAAIIAAGSIFWWWWPSEQMARRYLTEPAPQWRIVAAFGRAGSSKSVEWPPLIRPFLDDTRLRVRRAAACTLAGFGDAAGRRVLLATLQPIAIFSPATGRIRLYREGGDTVSAGATVAAIGGEDVVSPSQGTVLILYTADGAEILRGERIADLRPPIQTWTRLSRPSAGWE